MATNDKEITGNKDLKVSEALLKKSKNFIKKKDKELQEKIDEQAGEAVIEEETTLPVHMVSSLKSLGSISFDGKDDVKRRTSLSKNAQIEQAIKRIGHRSNNEIFTDMVLSGVEMVPFPPNGIPVLCAVGFYGDYKVVIPEGTFFILKSATSNFDRRLLSSVNFVVTNSFVRDGQKYVVGNRQKACKKLIKINWQQAFLKNKYVYGTKEPLPALHEGLITYANVVEVIPYAGVIVELGGLETFIKLSEISYNKVTPANIHDFVKVGEPAPIKILEVTNRMSSEKIAFTASIKQARRNPLQSQFDQITEGGTYIGEIVSFNRRLNRYVVKLKNDFEVNCDRGIYKNDILKKETIVSIQVYKKYKNSETDMRAYGKIVFARK